MQILAHRIIWSMLFLGLGLVILRNKKTFQYLTSYKTIVLLTITGFIIGINWLVYIYAVNNNHIVDASLGYYINPMVNILLGMIFLKERLSKIQAVAVVLAFVGVGIITFDYGKPPWVSLCLALTFGIYSLIRKKTAFDALPGLFIETLMLTPIAICFLWLLETKGSVVFHYSWQTDILLILAGPVTAVPLFFFGFAVPRIPLSTIGFIQYLSPTIQLLIGVFIFREPFKPAYFTSFILIWLGLALYSYSLIKGIKKRTTKIEANLQES